MACLISSGGVIVSPISCSVSRDFRVLKISDLAGAAFLGFLGGAFADHIYSSLSFGGKLAKGLDATSGCLNVKEFRQTLHTGVDIHG